MFSEETISDESRNENDKTPSLMDINDNNCYEKNKSASSESSDYQKIPSISASSKNSALPSLIERKLKTIESIVQSHTDQLTWIGDQVLIFYYLIKNYIFKSITYLIKKNYILRFLKLK